MRRYLLLSALLYLAMSSSARAQSPTPIVYRNLVMEGGGIRGIAYGGALQELEQRGVLAGLRRVGGTSAATLSTPIKFVNLKTLGLRLDLAKQIAYDTQPTGWPCTISTNTLGFNPKIRRMSGTQKQQLLESGRVGARAFFERQK